ncbi:MAG: Rrf2 family transcriptional regulator [Actinobacteria bacterium]|nr:Rrf2 family transcriptional regulator [Actinomycetota bacterium]
MKFSIKSEYALRAMVELAINYARGSIQISEIAQRQNIPERYLEQILLLLKRAGLIESARGARGGYSLSKLPRDVSLSQIVVTTEGYTSVPIKNTFFSELWEDIRRELNNKLNSITLQDLVDSTLKQRKILNYQI